MTNVMDMYESVPAFNEMTLIPMTARGSAHMFTATKKNWRFRDHPELICRPIKDLLV